MNRLVGNSFRLDGDGEGMGHVGKAPSHRKCVILVTFTLKFTFKT